MALFLVFLNESLDVAGPDINGVVHVCFGGKSHVHGFVAGNTADPQPEGVIDVVEIDVESGSDILAFVLLEIGPGQILPFGGQLDNSIKRQQVSIFAAKKANDALFVFRFGSSSFFALRVTFLCTVPVIHDDCVGPIRIDYSYAIAVMNGGGVRPVRIDYSCAIAVMNGGGMSPIGIDYRCAVAAMYGDGVGTVRIDDNSMLRICGITHHAQKNQKYASHNKDIVLLV